VSAEPAALLAAFEEWGLASTLAAAEAALADVTPLLGNLYHLLCLSFTSQALSIANGLNSNYILTNDSSLG
jgi:hypothetical protein